MAFTLQVIRGSTTYNISAGQPISLESLDDLGGASVRNLEESGPYQDGASHLGERLEPRTMTLRLNVVGSTASALDGHRDTLNAMFKPVRGVPITLKVTRDDGEIRQIDCRRTGPLSIPLHKENKPGNLHRAVVQLRAVDPTFYNPTEEEETFLGPSDWWLAYNTIGTAVVRNHAESPTAAQAMTMSSTVPINGAWTIVARTAVAPNDNDTLLQNGTVLVNRASSTLWLTALTSTSGVTTFTFFTPASGTANYFLEAASGKGTIYIDNQVITDSSGDLSFPLGTTGTWRTSSWDPAVPYAAVYGTILTATQRGALQKAMTDGGSAYSLPIVYDGDFDSYPVITITGPITSPVITNTTTGDVLNFTGGTVGSAEVWTVDTRYGRKSVLSGTVSKAQYLSNDSDLATFRLVADPLATGGTNVIAVGGSATSGSTSVSIAYYNRYMSF